MAIKLLPNERFVETQAKLKAEFANQAPDVVNLPAALTLEDAHLIEFDNTEYRVKVLSVQEGFQLERYRMRIRHAAEHPAQTMEDVDELEGLFYEITEYLWSLLDGKPEKNPFALARPREVGQLLSGFCSLWTIQNDLYPSRVGAARLATYSGKSTRSRSTTPH